MAMDDSYTCSIIHHVWFFSMHEHYYKSTKSPHKIIAHSLVKYVAAMAWAGTFIFDISEDHPESTGVYRNK